MRHAVHLHGTATITMCLTEATVLQFIEGKCMRHSNADCARWFRTLQRMQNTREHIVALHDAARGGHASSTAVASMKRHETADRNWADMCGVSPVLSGCMSTRDLGLGCRMCMSDAGWNLAEGPRRLLPNELLQ